MSTGNKEALNTIINTLDIGKGHVYEVCEYKNIYGHFFHVRLFI